MPTDSHRACHRRRRGRAGVARVPAAQRARSRCRPTNSAAAFLEALPGVRPGCVITDVRMPEMSGIDLLRRLKELERRHAGDRHHRPWRRSAGGRGDEDRRGRLPREAVRRRGRCWRRCASALDRAGAGTAARCRARATSHEPARGAVEPRARGAGRPGRRACPTRSSPSTSASARARSRSTAPT